jgi:hypothetical protein
MIRVSATLRSIRIRPSPRNLRVWLIAAGAALAVGCNDMLIALPSEGPPQAMDFALAEVGTDRRTVQVRGDTVVMRRTKRDDTSAVLDSVRVVPTAGQWRALWSAAERAGVRNWARRYADQDVVNGTGWGLRIVNEEGWTFESDGSNAYPDRNGREHDEVTEDFLLFVDAVGDLVGKPL